MLVKPFNQAANVAKAARPLWITQVTGALPCGNPGVDISDDRRPLICVQVREITDLVMEAVADEHVSGIGLLLYFVRSIQGSCLYPSVTPPIT